MWNTGCNVIYNRTPKRLLKIVDGEDPSRTLDITPADESTFKGTIVPWADRDAEVTTKGFKVQYYSNNRWVGWIYIFQDYHSNRVCWADWTSTSPYQDGKANAASFESSYIDVVIDLGQDDEGNLTVPVIEFVAV